MDKKSFVSKYSGMLNKVQTLTKQTNKSSVLIVQQRPNPNDSEYAFPAIRESISNIVGFVGVTDDRFANDIVAMSVGCFDKILIDTDLKRDNSKEIIESIVEASKRNNVDLASYSDIDTWISASINFIFRMESNWLADKKVMLVGRNPLATRMIMELVNRNVKVCLNPNEYGGAKSLPFNNFSTLTFDSDLIVSYDAEDADEFDVLLGCSIGENYEHLKEIERFTFKSIYDIGINNFSKDFISKVIESGGRAFRSDDRAGIAGIVLSIMETDYLVNNNMGRKNIGEIHVVSGGVIGQEGDVVVDNVNDPTVVLGIASGKGTFKSDVSEDDIRKVEKIKSLIQ